MKNKGFLLIFALLLLAPACGDEDGGTGSLRSVTGEAEAYITANGVTLPPGISLGDYPTNDSLMPTADGSVQNGELVVGNDSTTVSVTLPPSLAVKSVVLPVSNYALQVLLVYGKIGQVFTLTNIPGSTGFRGTVPFAIGTNYFCILAETNSGTARHPALRSHFFLARRQASEDVYVAGSRNQIAVIWKNRVMNTLTDGVHEARANAVFVSGSTVHSTGTEYDDTGAARAKYWINGAPLALTNNGIRSEALAVFVSGTDVYVAGYIVRHEFGYDKEIPVYWKNGEMVTLAHDNSNARANSIVVVDGIVHVVGNNESDGARKARYWKNGVIQTLTLGAGDSTANSIAVSGSKIVIAGNEGNGAVRWDETGAKTPLNTTGNYAEARGAAFRADGSWIAGGYAMLLSEDSVPLLWNNSASPETLGNGANSAQVYAVHAPGTAVFAAGYEDDKATYNAIAVYWKNGIKIPLDNGVSYSYAHSIFVVSR